MPGLQIRRSEQREGGIERETVKVENGKEIKGGSIETCMGHKLLARIISWKQSRHVIAHQALGGGRRGSSQRDLAGLSRSSYRIFPCDIDEKNISKKLTKGIKFQETAGQEVPALSSDGGISNLPTKIRTPVSRVLLRKRKNATSLRLVRKIGKQTTAGLTCQSC